MNLLDVKYLDDLDDGTVFDVHNGAWRGIIIKKDDKVYSKPLGHKPVEISGQKLTVSFGSLSDSAYDYNISIVSNEDERCAEAYITEFGYIASSRGCIQKDKATDAGDCVIEVKIDYGNQISLFVWVSQLQCYLYSGRYHYTRILEAEEKIMAAVNAVQGLEA